MVRWGGWLGEGLTGVRGARESQVPGHWLGYVSSTPMHWEGSCWTPLSRISPLHEGFHHNETPTKLGLTMQPTWAML